MSIGDTPVHLHNNTILYNFQYILVNCGQRIYYTTDMKKESASSNQRTQSSSDDFAKVVAKNMKDPEKAELTEEMMQAALDGNKELAAIFSRMIKAELDNTKSSAR
jgi:phage/plasmid-associated DNA primase